MKIYSIFNTLLLYLFIFFLPSPFRSSSGRSNCVKLISRRSCIESMETVTHINQLSQSMNFQCKLISREFMNTLSWRWKQRPLIQRGEAQQIVSRLFSSSDSSSTFLWPKVYTIRSLLCFFFSPLYLLPLAMNAKWIMYEHKLLKNGRSRNLRRPERKKGIHGKVLCCFMQKSEQFAA